MISESSSGELTNHLSITGQESCDDSWEYIWPAGESTTADFTADSATDLETDSDLGPDPNDWMDNQPTDDWSTPQQHIDDDQLMLEIALEDSLECRRLVKVFLEYPPIVHWPRGNAWPVLRTYCPDSKVGPKSGMYAAIGGCLALIVLAIYM